MDARPHNHLGMAVNLNFDEFWKVLSDEGVNPPVTIRNKIWAALKAKMSPPVTREAIEECVKVWQKTLVSFGASDYVPPSERMAIGRLIDAHLKDARPVKLALYGARFEKGPEGFDPSQYLTIQRISDPKNFGRLMRIGEQEYAKRQAKLTASFAEPTPSQEAMDKTPMSPEARAILEGMKKKGLIGG